MIALPQDVLESIDRQGYALVPKDKIQVVDVAVTYDSHLMMMSNISFDTFREFTAQSAARQVASKAAELVTISYHPGRITGKLRVILEK